MFIKLNENNVIVAYAKTGSIEGAIEVDMNSIPEDLVRGYWKYENGSLYIDENLKAEIEAPPVPEQSKKQTMQQQIDDLTLTLGDFILTGGA